MKAQPQQQMVQPLATTPLVKEVLTVRVGEGRGGGSAGETSTPESSECSSRVGEDMPSEGSGRSIPAGLTGKPIPVKGKGDVNTGSRLVSRFWKEMPQDG